MGSTIRLVSPADPSLAADDDHLEDVRATLPVPLAAGTEPLLLRPRDAAKLLAISERALWERTRRGEVVCVRIGRAVRYVRAALVSYIAALHEE